MFLTIECALENVFVLDNFKFEMWFLMTKRNVKIESEDDIYFAFHNQTIPKPLQQLNPTFRTLALLLDNCYTT